MACRERPVTILECDRMLGHVGEGANQVFNGARQIRHYESNRSLSNSDRLRVTEVLHEA